MGDENGDRQGGGRLFGLRERMYDLSETYLSGRQLQITTGVVADNVALVGAAGVGVCAALLLFFGRRNVRVKVFPPHHQMRVYNERLERYYSLQR